MFNFLTLRRICLAARGMCSTHGLPNDSLASPNHMGAQGASKKTKKIHGTKDPMEGLGSIGAPGESKESEGVRGSPWAPREPNGNPIFLFVTSLPPFEMWGSQPRQSRYFACARLTHFVNSMFFLFGTVACFCLNPYFCIIHTVYIAIFLSLAKSSQCYLLTLSLASDARVSCSWWVLSKPSQSHCTHFLCISYTLELAPSIK